MHARRPNAVAKMAYLFLCPLLVACSSPWACASESNGLLFHVSFDDTKEAGFAAGDPSAKSVKGKEAYTEGRKGKALVCGEKFAECCYYHVEGNIDVAEGSLELWIKPVDWESTDGNKHHVFFETETAQGGRLLLYKPSYSDKILFIVWQDEKTPFVVSDKQVVAKGRWHYVVATWKTGEVCLYVNGVLTGRDARPEVVMPPKVGRTFTVGDKPWGKPRSGGRKTLLDELKIHDRALSAGEVARRYKEASAATNTLAIGLTTRPPKIDGNFGPGEWDAAAAVTGFSVNSTELLEPRQTQVYATYDNDKFYVAFTSPVRQGTSLTANVKSRDGRLYRDDAIELFLAPDPGNRDATTAYYHFVGNSAGIQLDGKGMDNTWDCSWQYACNVGRTVDAHGTWSTVWTAELAIPFASLARTTPADGETWGVNFCRDWQSPQAYTSWAPTLSFHDQSRLGTLIFAGNGPVVRALSFGQLDRGKAALKAQVVNPKAGSTTELTGRIDVQAAGQTTAGEAIPVQLQPGAATPLVFNSDLQGKDDTLIFSVVDNTASRLLHHSAVQFGRANMDDLLVKMVLLPDTKGACELNIDIGVLPNTPQQPKVVATLSRADPVETLQTVGTTSFTRSIGQVSLSIGGLESGTYNVTVSIRDGDREVYARELTFTKPPDDWRNTNAGVTDRVLRPWTPMEVDGRRVRCWGREYDLGAGVLPAAIITGGAQILRQPIRLDVELADGTTHQINPTVQTLNGSDSKVTFTGSARCGDLVFKADCYAEFDGMMLFEITVDPVRATEVRSLKLVMPFDGRYMTLRHRAGHKVTRGVSTIGREDGWQLRHQHPDFMWIGDEDRGITWFMESQGPWPLDKGAHFTSLTRTGDTLTWDFSFIDHPTVVDKATTFVFGIQATPIKPLPSKWRSWGIDRNGTTWWTHKRNMKHFGYPESPDWEASKQKVKEFRDRGLMIAPYVCAQAYDEPAPEFQYYGEEWTNIPRGLRPKSKEGGFNSRHGNVCCGSEFYREWNSWKTEQFVKRLDLDGLYYDHSRPWRCTNARHGCEGSKRRILAMRELYRRNYTTLRNQTKGEQTFMLAHILESLCTPVIGFCDGYVPGEVLAGVTTHGGMDYIEGVDLDYFKSFMMGRQFGMVPMFLPEYRQKDWWRKGKEWWTPQLVEGTEKIMGIMLLLDTITAYSAYWDGRQCQHVWQVFDDYGISTDDTVEFLPYWSNARYISVAFKTPADPGDEYPQPLAGIHHRRGKCALVTVVNLTPRDRDVKVKLDLDALGLASGKLKVEDAFYDHPSDSQPESPYETTSVCLENGRMTLPIKARRFRLIGITVE